jgi:hypothetical protein
MILEKSLQISLMIAAIGGFFALMRRTANRPAARDPDTGEIVLQFSKVLVWIMGGIAFLMPLALAVLSFVIPFRNAREVYVPIVMGLFFLILGGWLCLYVSRRRTRLSKSGLTSEYLISRTAHMAWDEVTRVKVAGNQELLLYDAQGRRAWIHIWLVGVKEAIPVLREYLPASVQKSNEEALAKFYKLAEGR